MNSLEMGKLTEAEEACYSAVREAELRDPEGRHLATSLQAMACISSYRGRNLRAQRLYYRSWEILRATCGDYSVDALAAMVQTAGACLLQHKYDDAEPLFTEALALLERSRESELTSMVRCLHGLGDIHLAAKRRVAALVCYQRALKIQEKAQGANAPAVINTLHKLGDLFLSDARYQEAEPHYWRANKIAVAAAGPDSAPAARTLQKVAELYRLQNQFHQAEELLKRALPMFEVAPGPEHPEYARHLRAMSLLYWDQARYKDAAEILERAIGILEKALGSDHPEVADTLELRARALEVCHQPKLAHELRDQAAQIRMKVQEEDSAALVM